MLSSKQRSILESQLSVAGSKRPYWTAVQDPKKMWPNLAVKSQLWHVITCYCMLLCTNLKANEASLGFFAKAGDCTGPKMPWGKTRRSHSPAMACFGRLTAGRIEIHNWYRISPKKQEKIRKSLENRLICWNWSVCIWTCLLRRIESSTWWQGLCFKMLKHFPQLGTRSAVNPVGVFLGEFCLSEHLITSTNQLPFYQPQLPHLIFRWPRLLSVCWACWALSMPFSLAWTWWDGLQGGPRICG